MAKWLLLHYKIPPEPSAARVYIWRKLKRLGALLYLDALWVLPDSPREKEQFQWLAAEIVELGGEAALWEAQPALGEAEDRLIQSFTRQVDADYAEILEALERPGADPEALAQQYRQIRSKDYLQSGLGRRVREALLARRGAEE